MRFYILLCTYTVVILFHPARGTLCHALQFFDRTEESGIHFVHTDGSSGNYYLAETVTAGLGLFDYDNDGDLDIYFVNGAALPDTVYDTPPTNALYRNDGNNKFTDVTEEAGVGDTGFGLGSVMGDYDNDGDMDIYITNFGADVFYRNNGDGTFTDYTQEAGLGDTRLGAGCAFADFNNDGWLDLFVANYIVCPLDKKNECSQLGIPLYCDPSTYDMYEPLQSSLYLNNGDGTFRDFSQESGIAAYRGRGMGVSCTDYDNDGDIDIYVANDVTENFLYTNNGDATFEENGLIAGVAYDMHGHEQGSMACDFGDYDNDGLFDIIVTNYQNQLNNLYRNLGDGFFEDVTLATGVSSNNVGRVGWATFFFDVDNDGDQDLFVAYGHLQDRIEDLHPNVSYEQQSQLFRNNGDGTFTDISDESGPGMLARRIARGGAYGDLDGDGDLDIVLSNSRNKPTILVNDPENDHHWVRIKLEGKKSNRNGIGARVTVKTDGKTQMNEVRAGSSYQSHYDLTLHFGLGEAEAIEEIIVRWPSGQIDTWVNPPMDQVLAIVEGAGS